MLSLWKLSLGLLLLLLAGATAPVGAQPALPTLRPFFSRFSEDDVVTATVTSAGLLMQHQFVNFEARFVNLDGRTQWRLAPPDYPIPNVDPSFDYGILQGNGLQNSSSLITSVEATGSGSVITCWAVTDAHKNATTNTTLRVVWNVSFPYDLPIPSNGHVATLVNRPECSVAVFSDYGAQSVWIAVNSGLTIQAGYAVGATVAELSAAVAFQYGQSWLSLQRWTPNAACDDVGNVTGLWNITTQVPVHSVVFASKQFIGLTYYGIVPADRTHSCVLSVFAASTGEFLWSRQSASDDCSDFAPRSARLFQQETSVLVLAGAAVMALNASTGSENPEWLNYWLESASAFDVLWDRYVVVAFGNITLVDTQSWGSILSVTPAETCTGWVSVRGDTIACGWSRSQCDSGGDCSYDSGISAFVAAPPPPPPATPAPTAACSGVYDCNSNLCTCGCQPCKIMGSHPPVIGQCCGAAAESLCLCANP